MAELIRHGEVIEVAFVVADDWQGLYVDGQLQMETHNLRVRDVLEVIGLEFEYIDLYEPGPMLDRLEAEGRLPDTLADLKEAS